MLRSPVGVLFWSAGCLGIWLLTLSSLSVGELVVGSACSLGVGVVAVGAWRALGLTVAPTGRTVRPLFWLPIAIVSDAAQVLLLPLRWRKVRGQFKTLDIGAAGISDAAVTRRAIVTLATTATPASMVLDVGDDGNMTLHALPTRGPHMEEKFAEP